MADVAHPRYNRIGARGTTLICIGDEVEIEHPDGKTVTGIIRSIGVSTIDVIDADFFLYFLDDAVKHYISLDASGIKLVARP